ncbi:MAG: (d)CMP kinase [Candidatus Eisenbacteria bacterium]|nr:(d)CMP kinase [Candidatus Eisenbacteria bacterium]
MIIAIDGPAASGKSTTARAVAERLGYTYIDSGAMYRAAALAAMRRGVDLDDVEELTRVAESSTIELTPTGAVLLDGEDVTTAIRTRAVSDAASVVSTVPGVRRALVREQRRLGRHENCVMEGRDIGTVVFPEADLKVFLTAGVRERARRRHAEDPEGGATLEEIEREIAERDRRDESRNDSPLVRARDAVVVDTTSLTIEDQVDRVIELAVERGATRPRNADGALGT